MGELIVFTRDELMALLMILLENDKTVEIETTINGNYDVMWSDPGEDHE